MDKYFTLEIKGEEIKLNLNTAFSYKFSQFLQVDNATPDHIGLALVNKLQEDALGTIKYLISAGIYGHEFVSNDSYVSKYKPSDIGRMILDLDPKESERLVNAVFKELGFDLKAEAVSDDAGVADDNTEKKS